MSFPGLPVSARIYSMQAVVALLLSLPVGCIAVSEARNQAAAFTRDVETSSQANPKRNLVRRETQHVANGRATANAAAEVEKQTLGPSVLLYQGGSLSKLLSEQSTSGTGQLFCDADVQNTKMYDGPLAIYVAHADPPALVDLQFAQIPVSKRNPSVYATVIGSLAGLNGLLTITPEKILFYDMNPYMVEFAKLYTEIIKLARSRDEFIDFYFGRQMASCLVQNTTCTFPPWDQSVASKVQAQLPDDVKCAYDYLQREYMKNPDPTSGGGVGSGQQHRACDLVTLFRDPDKYPHLDPSVVGTYNSTLEPNTCSFYYGHGWLRNEYTFNTIRKTLQTVPVSFAVTDLAHAVDVEPMEGSVEDTRGLVNFASNIQAMETEWQWQFDLSAMRAGGRDVEVITTRGVTHVPTQTCPNSGVPGDANAHANAWHAVEAQIRNPRVLEIARRVPWGFYELKGRRINMEIHSFLNTSDFATHGLTESKANITVILHILVGEGESRENWQRAVQKAIQMAGQVLILEHNGMSTDSYGPPSGPKSNFFKPSEMLQSLHNMNVPNPYVCFIPGQGEARNFLVSIAS